MTFDVNTLNVCVTGRRHIVPEALERVETSARLFFRTLFDASRGSLVFRSGGAIGADTFSLRYFIDEKSRAPERDARAILSMPAPYERYRNDFSTISLNGEPSELDAFRELSESCDEIEVVSESLADDRDDYLAPYVRLGDFLCDKADILLAFWNGDVSEIKRGGTVAVVLNMLARNDGAIVYCISTPELKRRKNPDGTKTYVPESIVGAGDVAILRRESDLPASFVAPEEGGELLRALLADRLSGVGARER